jgi:hypothetical protein
VAGIPLLRGRVFREDETLRQPRVAVVSRSLARRYWPDRDVLGQRVRVGSARADSPWYTIVGVVDDVRYHGAGRAAPPVLYRAFTQATAGDMHFLVRTRGRDPAAMADGVRAAVAAVDRDVAVYWVRPLAGMLDNARWQPRLWALVCGVFGVAAWLLAILGVYGVTATSVQQRQREFGVRVALGARPADIARLVQREVVLLLGLGVTVGLAGALLLLPLADAVLMPGAPPEWPSLAIVAAVVCGAGLVAGWLPARAALRLDPAATLR